MNHNRVNTIKAGFPIFNLKNSEFSNEKIKRSSKPNTQI